MFWWPTRASSSRCARPRASARECWSWTISSTTPVRCRSDRARFGAAKLPQNSRHGTAVPIVVSELRGPSSGAERTSTKATATITKINSASVSFGDLVALHSSVARRASSWPVGLTKPKPNSQLQLRAEIRKHRAEHRVSDSRKIGAPR